MATDDPMARLRTIDAGPDDTVDLADTALILAALVRFVSVATVERRDRR